MNSVRQDITPVQPYQDISEFKLPERTHELIMGILWDFLKPCRQRLANARSVEKEAIAAANAKLVAADAAFQAAKEKACVRSAEIAAQVEGLRNSLNEARASALDYLTKQNVEVFSPPLESEPHTDNTPPLTIEECTDRLHSDVLKQVDAIKGNKPLSYWPKSETGRWILMLSILAYGIGLVWLLVVFLSRMSWAKGMQIIYRQILRDSQRLWTELDTIESGTKQSAQAEIETAEKHFLVAGTMAHAAEIKAADTHFREELRQIETFFSKVSAELHENVDALWKSSACAGAEWDSPIWQDWSPDLSPEFAARLGRFEITAEDLGAQFPHIDFAFALPALIPFAEGRCLLLNAAGPAKQEAAAALLAVIVRVLANTPPGKARFTFVDPVGLGQNVADFMHLGDVNKDLISGKAWSEPQHIEQQFTLLTEHMETVIQTCLRNEFATIRDYNRERHEVAQPFRFLVINDFPVNFTEAAARRLVSIVKNGPRCGVYTFIVHDSEKKLPYGFNLSDLEDSATKIVFANQTNGFVWQGKDFDEYTLHLDEAPPHTLTGAVVKKSGEVAIPAMKIDVPFEKVLAAASLGRDSWWSEPSAECLKVPLGPSGARALQELTLGGSQEAHALLVGRTGSGKTNLMHVIITALALKYAPTEAQLYLIDFKGGVGFKRYAEHRLPHAKVIAIESEREFGMSVLRGLDTELKQRSEIFRAAGVDSLTAYRAKMKAEKPDDAPMPRILLVVDEFQEFFSENDDVAQQAKIIFERLARQGRSFGIHFLLATQSLSGSAQLPASIMGQIKVRIALPCSEADSRLILADDNKAARALSLPGEAIYNPMGGLVEGNNRFQVARFSDDDLGRYLRDISESVRNSNTPIVFEGNELAHIGDCGRLTVALHTSDWPQAQKSVDLLLGEPIAIMPPVAALLRRQSGRNLMILTREESEGVGICIAAALSILSQQSPHKARIFIADFTTADSEWASHAAEIAGSFPTKIVVTNRQRDFSTMLAGVAKEVQARSDGTAGMDSVYLILQGMHRIKALREDDEDENGHNAVDLLKAILRDGPEVGVHVISWADTWGNATRGLDRKAIGEFGLRVAAVMESGDSLNFIDNQAASKISKPHRALFYDEDRPGQLVAFRPYAMPSATWLKETGERLKSRVSIASA